MQKALTLMIMVVLGGQIRAQDITESDLFGMNQTHQFETIDQMAAYIKDQKPTTYRYYLRLNAPARKRVWQQLQADQNSDITEMVLEEYRHRPRG